MKSWKVTAQLNMDASKESTIFVRANTERKARIFATESFKRAGAFHVTNMTVEEVKNHESV